MQDCISKKEAVTILKQEKNGVLIGDLWGYISNVNETLVKMFGAKNKKEFLQKHVLNFLVEAERSQAVNNSMDSILNNKGKTHSYKVNLKNGEIATLEVQTALITNKKGEKTGFIDIVKLASS
jgi:PAS domain S-box-containing protein